MRVQRAAVIGAGAMGSGIACVLAQCGIEVLLKDIEQSFVEKGLGNIKRMFESRVKKGTLSEADAQNMMALVKGTTSYDDFKSVDFVIEAAFEEISVKLDIFKTIDAICPSKTIFATNTSALSVSEIASATGRPEKFVGMHFFNPAQFMKLVEVIPGVKTSEETIKFATELCREMQKTPVKVEECPGFLVNRLLFTYMNEALYVLQEGLATPEELDAQVVAWGLPMGPLALFDLTGLDVCAHVNKFLYSQYGERFKPSPLLTKMVEAGCLGQKSGAGFYLHDKGVPAKGEAKKVNPKLAELIAEANKETKLSKSNKTFDVYRVILPMFNEGVYAIQEGVVDPADVDVAMQNGCGFKRGLMTIANEKGLDWVLAELNSYLYADKTQPNERFRASWLISKLVGAKVKDFSALGKKPVAVG
ncbi:MAG: 3-hydroxyacyl-CoA dehydrogenase [Cyanobacteria bacterium SZAS LIN-3]|nr:3-hydroxyacyl-CoA dehydrogenase [Cyanobacteria bacterium SZAS LIN-3]